MKLLPAFVLFLMLAGKATAGDEKQINEQLENAVRAGGGTVSLESKVYTIDDPVIIPGSDITLTGTPETIIRVSSDSSQWFTGMTGLICSNCLLYTSDAAD